MQIAPLGERDQTVGDALELLRLGQRGGNLLVLDERGGETCEQRPAMAWRAVQLPAGFAVTHVSEPPVHRSLKSETRNQNSRQQPLHSIPTLCPLHPTSDFRLPISDQ